MNVIIKNYNIIRFVKSFLLIIFYIFLYETISQNVNYKHYFHCIKYEDNQNMTMLLAKKVKEFFKNHGFVNINKVEEEFNAKTKQERNKNKENNEINIGFQLDNNFTLQAMMTMASILDSQKNTTIIRFHIAVVLNFSVFDMLKIYSLRKRIREDAEFNFYNASRVEKDLNGLNIKGPGAVAKLLLPQLLPDGIKKLLVFDTGDLLVLKDLSEQYNWEMKDYLYVGVPGKRIGQISLITNQTYKSYINTGSFLINVTKVKSENMYDKFVKYKRFYHSNIGDQDLLNDVAIGKVGMYPIKFGLYSPFTDDKAKQTPKFNKVHPYIIKYFPNNSTEFFKEGYIPYVIHQWNGKWSKGSGLTLFRRIAQYYIRYAGIWEETCEKFPGYCLK